MQRTDAAVSATGAPGLHVAEQAESNFIAFLSSFFSLNGLYHLMIPFTERTELSAL